MAGVRQRAQVSSRSFWDYLKIEKANQVQKHSEASFCDDLQKQVNLKKWVFGTTALLTGGLTGFLYATKHYGLSDEEKSTPFSSRAELSVCRSSSTTAGSNPTDSACASRPSVASIRQLCSVYGISPSAFGAAAVHLRPVEFHLHCTEMLLDSVQKAIKGSLHYRDALQKAFQDAVRAKPYLSFFGTADVSDVQGDSESQLTENLRRALYLFLVANWERDGYFDLVLQREGYFGRRHSDTAEGINIGTRGATYLYSDTAASVKTSPFFESAVRKLKEQQEAKREKQQTPLALLGVDRPRIRLSDGELDDCLEKLRKYGVVVLRRAVNAEEVKEMRRSLFSDTSHIASEIYTQLEAYDPNIDCRRPTRGRLHCLLRGTLAEPLLTDVQRNWAPVIYGYLPTEQNFSADAVDEFKQKKGCRTTDFTSRAAATEDETPPDYRNRRRLYVSDIQLVTSDPLCSNQFWHSDSLAPGLTVGVPLVDITLANGSTESLPGTHHLHAEKRRSPREWWESWKRFYRCYQESQGSYIPVLQTGDILIYDSRLNHRGLKNTTWEPRPMLLYRYDYEEYPPPYQHIMQSNYNRMRASLFVRLSGLYQSL